MKTAEQEALEGNPGHRKVNESMPEKDTNIPDAPKYLDRIGTRAYHELVSIVGPEGMQVMSRTDSMALSLICDAYAEYRDAKKTLDKFGRYLESDNGTIKRHPAVNDMQDAWKRIMAGLSKFGMTPYDRKNVNAIKQESTKETREQKISKRRALAAENAKKEAKAGNHIKKVASV